MFIGAAVSLKWVIKTSTMDSVLVLNRSTYSFFLLPLELWGYSNSYIKRTNFE